MPCQDTILFVRIPLVNQFGLWQKIIVLNLRLWRYLFMPYVVYSIYDLQGLSIAFAVQETNSWNWRHDECPSYCGRINEQFKSLLLQLLEAKFYCMYFIVNFSIQMFYIGTLPCAKKHVFNNFSCNLFLVQYSWISWYYDWGLNCSDTDLMAYWLG